MSQNRLQEIEKELKRLDGILKRCVKTMTPCGVSYSDWFHYSPYALENIKKNNRRGYNALMKYKEFLPQERALLKEKNEILEREND